MPTASCLCGNCKIAISKIISTGICRCTLCRKMTGSLFSLNPVVPTESFKVKSGTPKDATLPGTDSKLYFCRDCGSNLWNETVNMFGLNVLKAGILGEVHDFEDLVPRAEHFAARRPTWLHEVAGATQVDGMQEGVKEALAKRLQRSKI